MKKKWVMSVIIAVMVSMTGCGGAARNSKGEEKKTENLIRIETVERVRKFLNQLGRSNVKGLAEHARYSASDLEMELMRIKAHMSESKRSQTDFDCLKLLDKNEMRKLIYDMVIMYDLWFHDVKGEQE